MSSKTLSEDCFGPVRVFQITIGSHVVTGLEGPSEERVCVSLPVVYTVTSVFVYYESINRELNKNLICECRCDVRLKDKVEGSTRLGHTRWREEP